MLSYCHHEEHQWCSEEQVWALRKDRNPQLGLGGVQAQAYSAAPFLLRALGKSLPSPWALLTWVYSPGE